MGRNQFLPGREPNEFSLCYLREERPVNGTMVLLAGQCRAAPNNTNDLESSRFIGLLINVAARKHGVRELTRKKQAIDRHES